MTATRPSGATSAGTGSASSPALASQWMCWWIDSLHTVGPPSNPARSLMISGVRPFLSRDSTSVRTSSVNRRGPGRRARVCAFSHACFGRQPRPPVLRASSLLTLPAPIAEPSLAAHHLLLDANGGSACDLPQSRACKSCRPPCVLPHEERDLPRDLFRQQVLQ